MTADRIRESERFYRYITGKNPSETLTARYLRATNRGGEDAVTSNASKREEKILAFVIRNGWALGMIDGALAFSAPRGLLRQRLMIMTALAETEPENAALFLSRDRSFFYIFVIGTRLAWGAVKLVTGKLLLIFI
jgi:hypothetical protein